MWKRNNGHDYPVRGADVSCYVLNDLGHSQLLFLTNPLELTMKLFKQTLLAAAIAFSTSSAWADDLKIAAASDLKFALEDIKTAYVAANPGDKVDITFGSSGKLLLSRGAPFDLFFSPDSNTQRWQRQTSRIQ